MCNCLHFFFSPAFDEKQAQKRKEIESNSIFRPSKVQKLDSSPTDNKKLGIIKKHLLNVGNKKACPFNSNRLKTHSKSSMDKVSLGIKRKLSGNASNETAKEVNVDVDTSLNVREVEADVPIGSRGTDNVTHSVIQDCQTETLDDMVDKHVSHSEDDIFSVSEPLDKDISNLAQEDKIERNISGSEKDRTPAESLESDICHFGNNITETEDLNNHSNVEIPVKHEIDNDFIRLGSIARQSFQDLKHQIAKEIKVYSGDPTGNYKDDFADFSETNFTASKEKFTLVSSGTDETVEGKYFELKHTCDRKDFSMTAESENCEAVCDIKPMNDLKNKVSKAGTEIDTERETGVSHDTKCDRKSLSLVAIYSDSETDSNDSS